MSKDLIAVCLGGLLGGAFWLLTQIVGAESFALSWAAYGYALIGGVIAAGAATYIPADVNQTKANKVFFVSALAGLSFPSVISTAANAEDVAQIKGTNQKVESRVDSVQQQIASPTLNPAEVARDIRAAGVTIDSGPASSDVKQSYQSVSTNALDTLTAKAATAPNPTEYVKAIEQIGSVNPDLRAASTARLIDLSKSDNQSVSDAARPALNRQLGALPFGINEAVAASSGPPPASPPAER
jgi:hypothetical protein